MRGLTMKITRQLDALGQRLWLDNITRGLLRSGTLASYVDELSVTGLTSNPTIFDHAIGGSSDYDEAIRRESARCGSDEALFLALAIEDLREAARLFLPAHRASGGIDGWVSLEVSPLLADDARGTVDEAAKLHAQAACPNLFVKIPGTAAGVQAIEASVFAGIPINVTLLFSRTQYEAAADAYLRAIERRIAGGLDPQVHSVASLFVSRWDVAANDKVPPALRNRLGIAVAKDTYRAYRRLLASPRWRKLAAAGALPQRVLWASTGTKDPSAADTLYVEALAAPDTIDTLPDKTLLAFVDHGRLGPPMPDDGGDADAVLAQFRAAGVDVEALAARLQRDGADAFVKSWRELLARVGAKRASLAVTS
jgi:transaldolase